MIYLFQRYFGDETYTEHLVSSEITLTREVLGKYKIDMIKENFPDISDESVENIKRELDSQVFIPYRDIFLEVHGVTRYCFDTLSAMNKFLSSNDFIG